MRCQAPVEAQSFPCSSSSLSPKERKTLKYPTIFNSVDVGIIAKMDLTELVGFDLDAARASIQAVRPGMEILEVSAKTEDGMNSWIEAIISRHQEPSLNERKLTTTFIT